MQFPRSAGILLHLTSLPSPGGIGDLGPQARVFLEFLQRAGQTYWQLLPVGPTGYGGSPYQSSSSFAGNPLLVSLEDLAAQGWLLSTELASLPIAPPERVRYEEIGSPRASLLRKAQERFQVSAGPEQRGALNAFRERNAWWLEDYALFTALHEAHDGEPWTRWEPDLAARQPAAMRRWSERLVDAINQVVFVQYQFDEQWRQLRRVAETNGIRLIGDVPIFVAFDSADVWANQDLFLLNDRGEPRVVAGVPPDYFSESGQLWGNPLYDWPRHAERGFSWWISRLRQAFTRFDAVRIDHFRGFESHWEVPGGSPDARNGRWVAGPGESLFRAAAAELGPLPLIAEDLGLITPEVESLRDACGFPGMRVLQFAFGEDPKSADYRPHNYPRHCVAFTGTHDNDTTVGWFHSRGGEGTTRTQDQVDRERRFTLDYTGTDGSQIHWDLIRLAWSSVANLAIAPLQDVLGLDSASRMNCPGTITGNWQWRFRPEWLTPALESRLRRLTEVYGRTSAKASST